MNKAHVTKLARKHSGGFLTSPLTDPKYTFTAWELQAFANALEDSVYQRTKERVAAQLESTQKAPDVVVGAAYLQGRDERVFALTKQAALNCCKPQDLRTRMAIADLVFVEVVK